jgi:hypothetical protein
MCMKMQPERKLWIAISSIDDAMEIAPKGSVLKIPKKDLQEYLTPDEATQILKLLATDYGVIEFVSEPTIQDQDFFVIKIPNTENFKKIYDKAHHKFFGGLEQMSGDNFLAVMDVTMDIKEQLEMTESNQFNIPAERQIIRFPVLMPYNSITYHDRYIRLRGQALGYMVTNEYLTSYHINRALIPMEATFTVEVDRKKLWKFYERLREVYPQKVKTDPEPDVKDASKSESEKEFYFDQGVLHKN